MTEKLMAQCLTHTSIITLSKHYHLLIVQIIFTLKFAYAECNFLRFSIPHSVFNFNFKVHFRAHSF